MKQTQRIQQVNPNIITLEPVKTRGVPVRSRQVQSDKRRESRQDARRNYQD